MLDRLSGDDVVSSRHFGCYAVIMRENSLLCVRKSRGPYKGLWDLPGGAPELSESLEATLRRELWEETGSTEVSHGPWHEFRLIVEKDSMGHPIQFIHEGVWRQSKVERIDENILPSEDTAGLAWIELKALDRDSASALICHVIASIQ